MSKRNTTDSQITRRQLNNTIDNYNYEHEYLEHAPESMTSEALNNAKINQANRKESIEQLKETLDEK